MKYLLLSLFVFSQSSFAGPVWLTMSSQVLSSIQESLPPGTQVLEQNPDTSLVQMDQAKVSDLSQTIHEELNRCGGFSAHETKADAKSAMNVKSLWQSTKNQSFGTYEIIASDLIRPMINQVSALKIESTIRSLSSFRTRFYDTKDGIESSDLISSNWQQLTKSRSDISIERFVHKKFPQPTIILTIEGSTLPEEIVILGAHADSISDGKIAPGADDNASGIAAVTEVLRVFVENGIRPKRTVKFIAYAAEEVGLLGSEEVARTFKKFKKNVVGVLQLDMVLFRGTVEKDIILISDFTNKKQNEFLGKLIDQYVQVPWGYSRCGYGCSDHASWTAHGYPASFPFESAFDDHNPHIHTINDTIENAGGNAEHAVPFTKLALAFVTEMSF